MSMVKCPDCEKMISDSAPSCLNCGRPNSVHSTTGGVSKNAERKVSVLLGIGIFLIPFLFSWLTLRKGYSKLSRIIAFAWMGIAIIGVIAEEPNNNSAVTTRSEPAPKTTSYPASSASYSQVDSAVGCDSKYSDDKKDDVFNSRYKNHWFTWTGVVFLAESDEASLNIDGFGTQDLQVDFVDQNAGYDLVKDSTITVKFLMKTAGGCYLPFSGDKAVIVN